MADWIGRTISKVEIEAVLGRGGMADVYRGRHTTLNRPVAVKVMRAYIADDESLLARFTTEAQAVAALRHSHIVQVFDFDVADGRAFMVMELLDGITLKDYLDSLNKREEKFTPESAARLIKPLADALDYAHQRGIVHRDVKPANIMLRREGKKVEPDESLGSDVDVVLTDFGVARIADEAGQTASGAIVGTPAYMSPEQVRGMGIDARSDVYSLGVVLYEMLSGQLPFDGDTQASILMRHITDVPPAVSELAPDLQAVLDRALAKDAAERFQTAGGLAAALYAALGMSMSETTGGPYDTMEMLAVTNGTAAEVKTVPKDDTPPNRTLLYAIAAVGIAALVVGVLALSGVLGNGPAATGGGEEEEATEEASDGGAETDTAVDLGEFGDTDGQVAFQDATLTVTLEHLPAPPEGFHYQAWLIEPDSRPLALDTPALSDGSLQMVYVDPEGDTLLAAYSSFVLTVEDSGTPDQPGAVLVSATVNSESLARLRLLYDVSRGKPLKSAVLDGMQTQVSQFDSHLGYAVTAVADGSLDGAKSHSEHTINIGVGEGSADFGDWNGDNLTQNPGDAVGLVRYLQILRESVQAVYDADDVDADTKVQTEALLVQIDDSLQIADDAISLAMRLTAVDSVEEAQLLALDLDTDRLGDNIALIISGAQDLRLLIAVDVVAAAP